MITTEFHGAPRIISERKDDCLGNYWMRTEEGDYEPVSKRHFRLMASAAFGANQLQSLQLEAMKHLAEVRCIAGLKPGLYITNGDLFLNPAFVRLAKPKSLSRPSDEFRAIFDKCIEMKGVEEKRLSKQYSALQKKLRDIYAAERNVEPVKATSRHHPWTLLGMPRRESFPCDDHCQLFESNTRRFWTSQPYHIDVAAVLGFARLHKLDVRVSCEWSWHNPGSSILIEWCKG